MATKTGPVQAAVNAFLAREIKRLQVRLGVSSRKEFARERRRYDQVSELFLICDIRNRLPLPIFARFNAVQWLSALPSIVDDGIHVDDLEDDIAEVRELVRSAHKRPLNKTELAQVCAAFDAWDAEDRPAAA
jgi:hypothetical protein